MINVITSKQLIHNENAVYYFKKKYCINKCGESRIKIFADARYKLYINGVLVAVGPCRASSEIRYYDELDISEYLNEGENTFEVSVLQLANEQDSNKYMFLESVMRSGGMCLGIWGYAGDEEIITDESWLVAKGKGIEFFYEPQVGVYNATALYEKITPSYKKETFEGAVICNRLYDLQDKNQYSTELVNPVDKRPIPMMYFDGKDFTKIKNDVFDAGKLTCGYIRTKCSGHGTIKFTYAECMAFVEDGQIIKRNRDDQNGIIMGDYDIVEVDGECLFEPYWMRTFRYIKADIGGDVTIENIDYLETGYPIEISDNYDFGNELDNKLFEISTNTLRRCMHETYIDCPYYEQLQYTMDTHLQILFTYQLTQDSRLAEKAIDDFAKSYRASGLTQSRYPVNKSQYIPGFSLFFILMLYEHLLRFDNKEFIRKYLPAADGIVDWFQKRFDGYMVSKSNLWDFIDWSEEYDKDTGMTLSNGPITVYSLMLAYTLEKLYEIYKMLGIDMSQYIALSDKIKKDVKTRCYDSEKGLYADSPEKSHFAQHSQIWAVLCDMETGENAREILKKSMNLNCKATLAYTFYLLRAFEKADMYSMSKESIKILRSLVDLGCTTTPERMGEDVRSECHAWSAIAIYEFTAKVLGVTYRNNKISIVPYTDGRNNAKGVVATPVGMVNVDWDIADDDFTINIDLPENIEAVLVMPDNKEIIAKSGKYTCKVK